MKLQRPVLHVQNISVSQVFTEKTKTIAFDQYVTIRNRLLEKNSPECDTEGLVFSWCVQGPASLNSGVFRVRLASVNCGEFRCVSDLHCCRIIDPRLSDQLTVRAADQYSLIS